MPEKKTKKVARGGTLVAMEKMAPYRGEPEINTNKTAPKSIGGSPRNLSHSITSGSTPKEPNG